MLFLSILLIIGTESNNPHSDQSKPWWLHEKVKLKLCQIYKAKGMLENFVDSIFPLVLETLYCETLRQKVINKNFKDLETDLPSLFQYVLVCI